jgi:predicted dehydrogenase
VGKSLNGSAVGPLRVGVVGVGFISRVYFETLRRIRDEVRLVRVADLDVERAAAVGTTDGLEGSLIVPDPNEFSGTTLLKVRGKDWEPLPMSAGYEGSARGVGLLDYHRTAAGEVPRADADIAFHALEIMETMMTSSVEGRRLDLGPAPSRPTAVPLTSL